MRQSLPRLFCRLGVHGPDWFGAGAGVSTPRNYSVAPGHRRCTHCGTEFFAYETDERYDRVTMAWEEVTPMRALAEAAARAEARREGAIDLEHALRVLRYCK